MLKEIRNGNTHKIIFKGDYPTDKECVEDAIKKGIDLRGASLLNKILCGIDFSGIDLSQVMFRGSDLRDSIFCGAKFGGTNFMFTTLGNTNFNNTNLEKGRFFGADFNNVIGIIAGYYGKNHKLLMYSKSKKVVIINFKAIPPLDFKVVVQRKYGTLNSTDYIFFANRCEWFEEKGK